MQSISPTHNFHSLVRPSGPRFFSVDQSSSDKSNAAAVNGHKSPIDLNLVPIDKSHKLQPPSTTPPQKPFTITDLSPAPMHGSQPRVAYHPGAYSKAPTGKAYPNCEAIPCDQFEVAFQAVELWIADREVFPLENSLGRSIHWNYDLLLRHRLHIVDEVQLPVHHCLLALPGVCKEYLTRVTSHPLALAVCKHTLTKLGLYFTREAVDDTARAAKYIAVNNLRDTAAVASTRAVDLYGLQVLAFSKEGSPKDYQMKLWGNSIFHPFPCEN